MDPRIRDPALAAVAPIASTPTASPQPGSRVNMPSIPLKDSGAGSRRGIAQTPNGHSKEGSMGSVSDLGTAVASNSEWSEINSDDIAGYPMDQPRRQSSPRNARSLARGRERETAGVSRSSPRVNEIDDRFQPDQSSRTYNASPIRPLLHIDVAGSPKPADPSLVLGRSTPTPFSPRSPPASTYMGSTNAMAGPSANSGLGLNINIDGMDEETRMLIEQIQQAEEEEERQAAARRAAQVQKDAELAKKEQYTEGAVWEFIQAKRMKEIEQVQMDEREAVSCSTAFWNNRLTA
jgi:hypothetical protein